MLFKSHCLKDVVASIKKCHQHHQQQKHHQSVDRVNTAVILYPDIYVKKELIAFTTKLIKIEFNKKYKVNKEFQHLLDLETPIKDCLYDFLKNTNKLQKKIIIALNHVEVDQVLCMDYA